MITLIVDILILIGTTTIYVDLFCGKTIVNAFKFIYVDGSLNDA